MKELEKEAQRIVNRFYRVENGYQWSEAKKEALICVDEILCILYEYNDEKLKFYLRVKNQINLL